MIRLQMGGGGLRPPQPPRGGCNGCAHPPPPRPPANFKPATYVSNDNPKNNAPGTTTTAKSNTHPPPRNDSKKKNAPSPQRQQKKKTRPPRNDSKKKNAPPRNDSKKKNAPLRNDSKKKNAPPQRQQKKKRAPATTAKKQRQQKKNTLTERKVLPAWSGNTSTLRAWLRQLSFWELDNQVPKHRWGVKLFQAFPEGSIPRRIAEGLPMEVVMSENGYGAILTAVLEKFKPYLDAAGPAAIDVYFYQGDRAKGETFANYISAKELARQEVESLVGERIPERIAGRVLLRQASLSEAQRETLAIKHNALLTFEEVARALRPLDRPDALLRPMTSASLLANVPATSSYWTRDEENDAEAVDPAWQEGEEPEDDEDKAYVYEEPLFDETGEPLLYFEADREYDEEEALYIWAYNDAYNQIYFDHGRTEAATFPAYQDVRREMQARRKGRQFYRSDDKKGKKGKGRGFSSGRPQKGRGKRPDRASKGKGRGSHRGSASDLLSRTRCYNCGELGHFSRDCPANQQPAAEGRTNFVVSQGQGALNRTFMQTSADLGSPNVPKDILVFAGVRTGSGQGLVDSAAEEGVIGSGAFARLKDALTQQGLRPIQVRGPAGACAGIGGNAQVLGIWDVPIGVCQTNGLLRVTEVQDVDGFETPLLLPVSFQELIGMVIDYDKAEVRTRQGRTSPMQRLPSGHRAISVVEFAGRWQLPREMQRGGKDPFQLPRNVRPSQKPGPVQRHRGVTVWLRHPCGTMQELAFLEGSRQCMVLPSECMSREMQSQLEPNRVTFLDTQPGQAPYVINDVWPGNLGSRQLDTTWTGTVIFQQLNPEPTSSTTSTANPSSTMPYSPQASSGSVAAALAEEASLGPQHFDMSDSDAAHDFEGVFSSVGAEVCLSSPLCTRSNHAVEVWQRVREKSRSVFSSVQASMKRGMPKHTAFFMAWARDRTQQQSMFTRLATFLALTSCHAASSARACARRAGRATEERTPTAWIGVVPEGVGQVGASHREDDHHGSRPNGGRCPDCATGPELYSVFFDSSTAQASPRTPATTSPTRLRTTDESQPDTESVAQVTRGLRAHPGPVEDAGQPSDALVGVSQLWEPMGEDRSCHREPGPWSSARTGEAGVSIHGATSHVASTENRSSPGFNHSGAGPHETFKKSDECEVRGIHDGINGGGLPEGDDRRQEEPRFGEDGAPLPGRDVHPRAGVCEGKNQRGRQSRVRFELSSSDVVPSRSTSPRCGSSRRSSRHAAPTQRVGGLQHRGEDVRTHGKGERSHSTSLKEPTSWSTSDTRPLPAKAVARAVESSRVVCDQRQRPGAGSGQDTELVLNGGPSGAGRAVSEVQDDYTSNDTTSTTSFVMLESADSFVRRSMARRGYGSVCGLAILLSSVGHMSPQAASTTSKLPFHRLEAGVLQSDESKSMSFVLFQLPGSEFNDLYLGSFFCNSVSLLQKPLKTSVIASLEKLCSSEREPQEQQPQGTAATSSSVSTTTSLHQLGKQPSTPTRVPEEQDLDPSATASSSSTTTSLHQVGKQPSTPTRVPSVLETWPVSSQVQDEGLKDTGRYGARAFSFQFAWDFRQRHDRGRALQAVKECCPAFVTGFVSGGSWEVMVSIAKEQDDTGRLYALVCKAQARRGLLKQLPQATAIATSLVKQGPQMYFIVNDKTLSRIFASLDWHNSP